MIFHVISIFMTGITVTRRNGNLLACKTAQPEDSERIRHEAQLLKRLEHPGIVQFVDFIEESSVELYLAFVGPDSWATQPPSTPSESLEALASAASTVADLHGLGTVHGALCPEHVLVAPDKRPVLCGLADATALTETGCAHDLAGLAGLIDHLGAACEEKERRQLDALARRAERGSVTASDLTAELDRLHGGPHKFTGRSKRTAIPTPSRRASAIATALIALAVLGWLVLKPEGSANTVLANTVPELSTVPANPVPTNLVPAGQVPTNPVSAGQVSAGQVSAGQVSAGQVSAGQVSAGQVSTNTVPAGEGSGAPGGPVAVPATTNASAVGSVDTTELAGSQSEIDHEDRLIITHQGRRYGVGRLGDVAILGDWTCDGDITLALLQPSTGVIAVFADWPAPSQRLEADFVTVVEGATDLRNDPSGGCDQLRVTHAGGSTLIDTEFS